MAAVESLTFDGNNRLLSALPSTNEAVHPQLIRISAGSFWAEGQDVGGFIVFHFAF